MVNAAKPSKRAMHSPPAQRALKSTAPSPAGGDGGRERFHFALLRMLQAEEGILSWSNGSVHIADPMALQRDLLPRFMRTDRYESFLRQLHLYRFRKVEGKGRWNPATYAHPDLASYNDARIVLQLRPRATFVPPKPGQEPGELPARPRAAGSKAGAARKDKRARPDGEAEPQTQQQRKAARTEEAEETAPRRRRATARRMEMEAFADTDEGEEGHDGDEDASDYGDDMEVGDDVAAAPKRQQRVRRFREIRRLPSGEYDDGSFEEEVPQRRFREVPRLPESAYDEGYCSGSGGVASTSEEGEGHGPEEVGSESECDEARQNNGARYREAAATASKGRGGGINIKSPPYHVPAGGRRESYDSNAGYGTPVARWAGYNRSESTDSSNGWSSSTSGENHGAAEERGEEAALRHAALHQRQQQRRYSYPDADADGDATDDDIAGSGRAGSGGGGGGAAEEELPLEAAAMLRGLRTGRQDVWDQQLGCWVPAPAAAVAAAPAATPASSGGGSSCTPAAAAAAVAFALGNGAAAPAWGTGCSNLKGEPDYSPMGTMACAPRA